MLTNKILSTNTIFYYHKIETNTEHLNLNSTTLLHRNIGYLNLARRGSDKSMPTTCTTESKELLSATEIYHHATEIYFFVAKLSVTNIQLSWNYRFFNAVTRHHASCFKFQAYVFTSLKKKIRFGIIFDLSQILENFLKHNSKNNNMRRKGRRGWSSDKFQ